MAVGCSWLQMYRYDQRQIPTSPDVPDPLPGASVYPGQFHEKQIGPFTLHQTRDLKNRNPGDRPKRAIGLYFSQCRGNLEHQLRTFQDQSNSTRPSRIPGRLTPLRTFQINHSRRR